MASAVPPTDAERMLTTAALFFLALLLAQLAFNAAAIMLGYEWPYNTFMYKPADNFGDFFETNLAFPGGDKVWPGTLFGMHDTITIAAHYRPYPGLAELERSPYSPLHMSPVTTLISLLSLAIMRVVEPAAVFVCMVVLLLAYGRSSIGQFARDKHEALAWSGIAIMSYPLRMLLTRGNLHAGLTCILLIQAMLIARRGDRPVLAAVLLAIAANLRPNAILLAVPVILMLPYGRVRATAALIGSGTVIFVASLWAAHAIFPDYTIPVYVRGLAKFHEGYIVGNMGLAFGSSLFGAMKLIVGYRPGLELAALLAGLAVLGAGAILFVARRISATGLIFLSCAGYCLGSSVFADYHLLVFLTVPMVLMRETEARKCRPALPDLIAMIASCAMLAPKNYIYSVVAGPQELLQVSWQVVANPLILVIASVAIITLASARGPAWRWDDIAVWRDGRWKGTGVTA